MDYANQNALFSTDWLAENLNSENVRICDATYFLPGAERDAKAEFAAAHIPGAVFFDIDDICDPESDLPHMLSTAELFADKVGALGIGNDDKVIVYDANGGGLAAARAWWMFRIFGHDNVALLNGCLPKWLAEGRPVTDEAPSPSSQIFKAVKNEDLVKNLEQLLKNIDSGEAQVADARASDRFDGTAPEPRPGARSGHIPGARSLPYLSMMDKENNFIWRGADDISSAIAEAGLDLQKPVITSCGSGVTACVLALGFYLLGKEDVAIYDGSWSEWGSLEETPVETKA